MTIGQNVAYHRERKGLSQAALGKASGVSQVAICKIETGQNIPRIETLTRIAVALGVAPSDLFAT